MSMPEVSVVIPNYNGLPFLPCLMKSLKGQTFTDFEVVLVDNGSQDGSLSYLEKEHPWVRVVALSKNHGFSEAVNIGIRESAGELVLLLNNDTEVEADFIGELVEGIRRHGKAFGCGARMMQFQDRSLLDDAGNFYCALGWAFARGKGKPADRFLKEIPIFSPCAGAAIYRRDLLEAIGLFDEAHFAYLEDVDLGYRARLFGYENWYIPSAVVYHVGSGTSGSRHNAFKTTLSARNNLYLLYKNMPLWQLVLNSPLLLVGFLGKGLYFTLHGLGKAYGKGLLEGVALCASPKAKERRGQVPKKRSLWLQLSLWANLFRYVLGF